jgi:hypothetical protein
MNLQDRPCQSIAALRDDRRAGIVVSASAELKPTLPHYGRADPRGASRHATDDRTGLTDCAIRRRAPAGEHACG